MNVALRLEDKRREILPGKLAVFVEGPGRLSRCPAEQLQPGMRVQIRQHFYTILYRLDGESVHGVHVGGFLEHVEAARKFCLETPGDGGMPALEKWAEQFKQKYWPEKDGEDVADCWYDLLLAMQARLMN